MKKIKITKQIGVMMTEDERYIAEVAEKESKAIIQDLIKRYPSGQVDSTPIILNTIENCIGFIAIMLEKQMKPKILMRLISKHVVTKVKIAHEHIKQYEEQTGKPAISFGENADNRN